MRRYIFLIFFISLVFCANAQNDKNILTTFIDEAEKNQVFYCEKKIPQNIRNKIDSVLNKNYEFAISKRRQRIKDKYRVIKYVIKNEDNFLVLYSHNISRGTDTHFFVISYNDICFYRMNTDKDFITSYEDLIYYIENGFYHTFDDHK